MRGQSVKKTVRWTVFSFEWQAFMRAVSLQSRRSSPFQRAKINAVTVRLRHLVFCVCMGSNPRGVKALRKQSGGLFLALSGEHLCEP